MTGTPPAPPAARPSASSRWRFLLAACGPSAPEPTPYPTTAPVPSIEDGRAVVDRFLGAWAAGDYAAMYALVAPADREAYPVAAFTALYRSLHDLARVTAADMQIGRPYRGCPGGGTAPARPAASCRLLAGTACVRPDPQCAARSTRRPSSTARGQRSPSRSRPA